MRLVLAFLAFLLPSVAFAQCTPPQATKGMLGCLPVSPSIAGTDFLQSWIPGAWPNSTQIVPVDTLFTGRAIAPSSLVVGSPTGGNQGAGTVNATGLFINGVAVGIAPNLTSPGPIGTVTPGVGVFTSVNKLTLTQPATSATLTILDGKTLTVSKTLTLTGTDGTTMTFPATNQTIPGLTQVNAFTARQFLQGSATAGTTVGASDLSVNGGATSTRAFQIQAASTARWSIAGTNSGVVATNADTDLTVGAFFDTGAFNNFMFKISRGSGPLNLGPPVAYDSGPIYTTHTAAVTAGGTVGNRILINDQQPVYPLAANPISTVSGSPTVTVALTAAATIVSTNPPSWVNLLGVTATGGITPTGWLEVQSIATNSFTVTWTSNATSTAGPAGGSAVTIQPAFPTSMIQNNYTANGGSQGFNAMHSNIYNVDPLFNPLVADKSHGNVGYTMYWNVASSRDDAAGTFQTNILEEEMDLLYRGIDTGYQPLIAKGVTSLGKLYGPLWTVPNYITSNGVGGVGTPTHINTMWTLFGNNGFPAAYDALTIQPSALVGKGIDTTTSHGGVGLDFFGSYALLPGINPFTTATGTATVTVKTIPTSPAAGQLSKQVSGVSTVYIPNTYTISGVTFGGGIYTVNNVDDVNGHFTITGAGSAGGNVAGGGSSVVVYFTNLSPYAAFQMSGLWEDGIRTDVTLSRFTSGLLIHTQPGIGMGWDDGTGIASITGVAGSAGNVGVLISRAGTGTVNISGFPTACAGLPTGTLANVAGTATFCP